MAQTSILECSFFIPLRRDADLSDGEMHDPETWDWLTTELHERFHGGTAAPGTYFGFYKDPDTGQRVVDESYRFIVAVDKKRVREVRQLLSAACVFFQQKMIYLSVAGYVEFVEPT